MVAITVKNIPAEVYEHIKERARQNHRSINSEVITILEQSLLSTPIDVAETLERTRRVRELTARYVLKDAEIARLKGEGRK